MPDFDLIDHTDDQKSTISLIFCYFALGLPSPSLEINSKKKSLIAQEQYFPFNAKWNSIYHVFMFSLCDITFYSSFLCNGGSLSSPA